MRTLSLVLLSVFLAAPAQANPYAAAGFLMLDNQRRMISYQSMMLQHSSRQLIYPAIQPIVVRTVPASSLVRPELQRASMIRVDR